MRILKKSLKFVLQARDELRQVQWPSRKEALYLTAIVIGFSIVMAIYLGAFDTFFSYILRTFVISS